VEVTDSGQGGKASGTMALTSVKLKLYFSKADSDSLTIKGTLEIPDGFVPKDTPVTVDIGGVLGGFTLDEKGKARQDTAGNTDRKLHIKCKFKKGALVAGETSFKVSFKKGEFEEIWKTRGLLDEDVEGNTIELPVILETTDRAYSNYASGTYSASEGKTGSFIAR
jgi:hypothetical protein